MMTTRCTPCPYTDGRCDGGCYQDRIVNPPVIYGRTSGSGGLGPYNWLGEPVKKENLPAVRADVAVKRLALAVKRASELRAKAAQANLFEGKRVELLCAAREIEKLIEDMKAL